MKKRLPLLLLLFSPFFIFAQMKVVAYLPTWANFPNSINSVQLSKITHINVAFANPNNSGTIILSDSRTTGHLATVVNASHNQNVKVFLSIGGAGAPGTIYQTLLSNNTNMNNFVSNLVNYCINNSLDGIDVDIEGDVLNGTYVTKTQYENFVTALATALHAQNLEMTAALATWFATYVSNTAASKFDWINIMSYDAYGPWSGAGEHSTYNLAVSDFTYWKNTKGVPGNKLVIGVPFYGYGWGTYSTSNELSYATIVSTYSGAETKDKIGSGSNMISYNGIPTIQQKTIYACANAAGIMIWQITEDATGAKSLLSTIYDQITACSVGIEENIKNTQPINVYPNPANDVLHLSIYLYESAQTKIAIYDALGKEISVLNNATLAEGNHQFNFNSNDLPTGIYYVKTSYSTYSESTKFIKQ